MLKKFFTLFPSFLIRLDSVATTDDPVIENRAPKIITTKRIEIRIEFANRKRLYAYRIFEYFIILEFIYF